MMPQPPAVSIPPVPSDTYLHFTTLSHRPKIVVFGDSITEQGSSHANGWVTSLSIRYNRRADVINRGLNGYNSRWGKSLLPLLLEDIFGNGADCNKGGLEKTAIFDDADAQILQLQKRQKTSHAPKPTKNVFLLAFGANDSCLPNGTHSRHHVPLEEYSSNLRHMVQSIQSHCASSSSLASSTIRVALVTPPPCDTEKLKGSRDNENVTKLYSQECIRLAKEMGVPHVDLWTGMQQQQSATIIGNKGTTSIANGSKNDNDQDQTKKGQQQCWKTDYLSDGLHLTPMGNYRVYQLVTEMLDRPAVDDNIVIDKINGKNEMLDAVGLGFPIKELPRQYPDHSLVDAQHPENTFHAQNR